MGRKQAERTKRGNSGGPQSVEHGRMEGDILEVESLGLVTPG